MFSREFEEGIGNAPVPAWCLTSGAPLPRSWSSGPRASCALMIMSAQDARGPEESELFPAQHRQRLARRAHARGIGAADARRPHRIGRLAGEEHPVVMRLG